MNLEDRIKSFVTLGEIMLNALAMKPGRYTTQINTLINNQYINNPWFTPDNVKKALSAIATELTMENLHKWTNAYPKLKETREKVKVGIIMAGNIPMVGFHDFLTVLISGNKIIAKTSSKDSELIVLIGEILCSINPAFSDRIEFTEGSLTNFDVVIATGSNNSSRYFDYYFRKYPHIIRKNKNSIAIIEGDESDSEIENLGKDIFSYFGLGCRNISKIYIPEGYDILSMTKKWDCYSEVIDHTKYANNYDFNKAVYIVNKEKFIDTGYLLLKEESVISSPVSVLYYEYYDFKYNLEHLTKPMNEKIQCIVGKNHLDFGMTQSPHLWDYADGIDTIEFLLKKTKPRIG